MIQGVVSLSVVSPALSSLKVKAAKHKPAQEQLKCSDLEFLLSPATPALSLCFVPALLHAFFLAPMIQVLEQHNYVNRFCSLKALKRQWSAGREGRARREGSRESSREAVRHQKGSAVFETAPAGQGLQWKLLLKGKDLPAGLTWPWAAPQSAPDA